MPGVACAGPWRAHSHCQMPPGVGFLCFAAPALAGTSSSAVRFQHADNVTAAVPFTFVVRHDSAGQARSDWPGPRHKVRHTARMQQIPHQRHRQAGLPDMDRAQLSCPVATAGAMCFRG